MADQKGVPVRNSRQSIQAFLKKYGFEEMNRSQQQKFIKDSLPIEQLRQSVASTMSIEAKTAAQNQMATLTAARTQRQLLGIQQETVQFEQRQNQYDTTQKGKTLKGWLSLGSLPSKLFGKSNQPSVAKSQGSSISLAFLLLILLILWSAFAVVTTSNGTKTTRIKLFGSVLMGQAKVTA